MVSGGCKALWSLFVSNVTRADHHTGISKAGRFFISEFKLIGFLTNQKNKTKKSLSWGLMVSFLSSSIQQDANIALEATRTKFKMRKGMVGIWYLLTPETCKSE